MNTLWKITKTVARTLWFREGTVRRCFLGPYAGLRFELCPQLVTDRMCIFYQAYEPDVTSCLSRVVKTGQVGLVVGAHVGIHTLYMAKLMNRRGTVYAFEAWPENFQALVRNIKHNHNFLAYVEPINMAVCNHTGTASITRGATDGTHHLTRHGEAATCDVPCTTLDSFVSQATRRPDVILIDIEGAEMDLLKGARKVIRESMPTLIIEHHGPVQRARLQTFLRENGYCVHLLGNRHIHAENASRTGT